MSIAVELPTVFKRHKPQNVNTITEEKMSFMNRIGLKITIAVDAMTCAVIFAVISFISLPTVLQQIFSGGHFQPVLIVQWIAQTFLQLVLLSIIMVGQNVQNMHAEVRANEEYETTMTNYTDIENIMQQLESQKIELQKQT
jgi:hypothetical protein